MTGIDEDFNAVALVGMAAKLPGARNVDEFWRNVDAGRCAIEELSLDELRSQGVPEHLILQPGYRPFGAFLPDIEAFDNGLFRLSPAEAATMDPQHRLMMEVGYQALESAGCIAVRPSGDVGVFVAAKFNTFLLNHLAADLDLAGSVDDLQTAIASDRSYAAARLSHALGLEGPSLAVDTACASGLVAVHLACRSLNLFECDAALVAAAAVNVPHRVGYLHRSGGVLSADGRCRSFDRRGTGLVPGNGAVAVVLKRLKDALADGDDIQAVVRGTAVSNDGAAKSSFLVPGIHGQRRAIAAALEYAGIDAAEVGLVEATGNGAPLADGIEIQALTEAFGQGGVPGRCVIGSAKANIGHLDAASGLAGLVKAALALRHRRLPATAGFEAPPEEMHMERTPFRVLAEGADWPSAGRRRVACVNAYGIGGTNCHAVLTEAPPRDAVAPSAGPQLFVFATRDDRPVALERYAEDISSSLRSRPEVDPAAAAFTLQSRRRHDGRRGYRIARAGSGGLQFLPLVTGQAPSGPGTPPILLMDGIDAATAAALRGLHGRLPVFTNVMDQALAAASRELGIDLRPAWSAGGAALADQGDLAVLSFALNCALARQWLALGVAPRALFGRGPQEAASAVLAGAMDMADGARLAFELARHAGPGSAGGDAGAAGRVIAIAGRAYCGPVRFPFGSALYGAVVPAGGRIAPLRDDMGALDPVALRRTEEELERHLGEGPRMAVVPAGIASADDGDRGDAVSVFLAAVGELWLAGQSIDWTALHAEIPGHALLPPSPLRATRCWRDKAVRHQPPPSGSDREDAPSADARPLIDRVAAVWCEVLGHDRIDPDVGFFDLGGHSLNGLRILSRLNGEFRVDMAVADLFAAPTIRGVARHIESLATGSARRGSTIPRVERRPYHPLSPAQERFWITHRLRGDNSVYNEGKVLRIGGSLDPERLRRAIAATVARHEILRTCYPEVDGRPVMAFTDGAPDVPVLDLTGVPDGPERQSRIRQLADLEYRRPFDLATGPVYRIKLIRCSDTDHVLIVFLHHIVSDGLSLRILLDSFLSAYEGTDPPVPMADAPGYIDYAEWRHAALVPDVVAADTAYWARMLDGLVAVQRTHDQTGHKASRGFVIERAVTGNVRSAIGSLARRLQTTPFTLLCAFYSLLLGHLTGGRDIAFTLPVTERRLPELENLVGPFINTLPLRARLRGAMEELVRGLGRFLLEGLEHATTPFETVQANLGPERQGIAKVLGAFRFAFVEGVRGTFTRNGLTFTTLPFEREQAKFDMLLTVEDLGDGYHVAFECRDGAFQRAEIDDLADQFTWLLQEQNGLVELPVEDVLHRLEGRAAKLRAERERAHQSQRRSALQRFLADAS